MNVTEKDAKTKFCSYRDVKAWSDRCKASECMSWKWGPDIVEELQEVILPSNDKPEGKIGNPVPAYEQEYWVSRPTASSGFTNWTKCIRYQGGYCGRDIHV